MKTIITKEIDGYKIIYGFGSASAIIDVEATKPIVQKEIEKSNNFKEKVKLLQQMAVYAQQAQQAKRNAKDALTDGEKRKFMDEFNFRYSQMKEIEKDLHSLDEKLKVEQKKLIQENAVYFSLKLSDGINEKIISDEDAENIMVKMQKATSEGKHLDIDGNEIDDYRFKKYWKKVDDKWLLSEPSKLGDVPEPGSIKETDLTDGQVLEIQDQKEKERIGKMKTSERVAEKDRIISGLVSRAAQLKNEYEITGKSKPLEKAQTWLADETAKVETKYS